MIQELQGRPTGIFYKDYVRTLPLDVSQQYGERLRDMLKAYGRCSNNIREMRTNTLLEVFDAINDDYRDSFALSCCCCRVPAPDPMNGHHRHCELSLVYHTVVDELEERILWS